MRRWNMDSLLSTINGIFGGVTAVYVATASISATVIAAVSGVVLVGVIVLASR
jgi:hypothetical protein